MFVSLNHVAHFFAAIGAMNWGFAIFFNFNIVNYSANFCNKPEWNRYFYALIALSGFYTLLSLFWI